MRRNLLCFLTGAVVALAVVLLVRSGRDDPQPAAANTTPAVTTPAREAAPNVRIRGHHVSPRGHHARGATTTSSTTSNASSPSGSAAATTTHRKAAATRKPARQSGDASDPTSDIPSVPDDSTTATPPTDTGTTPPPSDDPSAGSTTPNADSAVTIPNQATPDGSVGTP